MSTQRRATCMNRTRAQIAPDTRISFAVFGVLTIPNGVTESLPQDPRFIPLDGQASFSQATAGPRTIRRSSPLAWSLRTVFRLQDLAGTGLRPPGADLISLLSGSASSHPALPQAPTGRRRRAERYDGKGNLYLQYAA